MSKIVYRTLAVSLVALSVGLFNNLTLNASGEPVAKTPAEKTAAKPAVQTKPKVKQTAQKAAETKKVIGKDEKKAEGKSDSQAKASSDGAKSSAYDGAPVLDPSRFFGAAAMGYASAKACPEIVSKLFCYCGCDISDSHNTLIDCFTSTHGVDCHICQEEAVLALKMHRDDASVADIQKAVDQQFAAKYPWKEDSPAYIKYKATREWKPFADTATDSKGPNAAATSGAKEDTSAAADKDGTVQQATASTKSKDAKWNPVLKPGFNAGSCCSKEKEHKK